MPRSSLPTRPTRRQKPRASPGSLWHHNHHAQHERDRFRLDRQRRGRAPRRPMATTKRDYYEVLGVGRSATEDEIRKAYRKLALQYHPDRNKEDGASDQFKEVAEAYAILSDGEKRGLYDRYGHAASERGFTNGGFGGGFAGFGIEDIFESFFGQNAGT